MLAYILRVSQNNESLLTGDAKFYARNKTDRQGAAAPTKSNFKH